MKKTKNQDAQRKRSSHKVREGGIGIEPGVKQRELWMVRVRVHGELTESEHVV